ncbi:MAG: TlpA disulfide reductase family protein, partial [Gammaproteobacteria bacterium]|nr:TlpA disulfide reductase family protein [Gammaproteobacteria bacterium]
MPDITLQMIDGKKMNLANIKGKPLLVNFWATTCTVCMQELPDMIALYRDNQLNGLEIIAIAMP